MGLAQAKSRGAKATVFFLGGEGKGGEVNKPVALEQGYDLWMFFARLYPFEMMIIHLNINFLAVLLVNSWLCWVPMACFSS